MRKQNSMFKTAFLSEAGSELKNHDYFAYVELDEFACYVLADGLSVFGEAESAKLAIETIILKFQEHPSMKKGVISSYLHAANEALLESGTKERLKASVTVLVSNYESVRYGFAGNTRLRMYRDGNMMEQSRDMSLSQELLGREKIPEDVVSKHEERNNLYGYLGQEQGFKPEISGRMKLANGDIITLYTRGIWENVDDGELDDVFSEAKDEPQESLDNVEELLLARQPEQLENYTLAVIFVDKVFLDPNRARKIKKRVTAAVAAVLVVLLVWLVVWIVRRVHTNAVNNMNQYYTDTVDYIHDQNFVRAQEECKEALKAAKKLRNKKKTAELTAYLKLIESVNEADEAYGDGKYEDAQAGYVTAKERSRYADHAADTYVEKRLSSVTNLLSVFDYIQLGDSLAAQGDYNRAEEKYLEAKRMATATYYPEGRTNAMESLEAMYTARDKAEEEEEKLAKARAADEIGAAELAVKGDAAFAEGDYMGANAFYAMALEKYQELEDENHIVLVQAKMQSGAAKAAEIANKEMEADEYLTMAEEAEESGDMLEAKKQYLNAKNAYKSIKQDDKVTEIEGVLEVVNTEIEQADVGGKEDVQAEAGGKEDSQAKLENTEDGSGGGAGEKIASAKGVSGEEPGTQESEKEVTGKEDGSGKTIKEEKGPGGSVRAEGDVNGWN